MSRIAKGFAGLFAGAALAAGAMLGVSTPSAQAGLMFDVQALTENGDPVADPKNVQAATGTVITYQIVAQVTGADLNPSNDGFQSGEGRLVSTGSGLGIKGDLTLALQSPFNANGSQAGLAQDIDGDTDLDIGGISNVDGASSGRVVHRAASVQMGGAQVIATGTFTVTADGDTTNTLIDYQVASMGTLNTNPLWEEDGAMKNHASGTVTSSPLTIVIPEPSALSLMAAGALTLIRRRRQG